MSKTFTQVAAKEKKKKKSLVVKLLRHVKINKLISTLWLCAISPFVRRKKRERGKIGSFNIVIIN